MAKKAIKKTAKKSSVQTFVEMPVEQKDSVPVTIAKYLLATGVFTVILLGLITFFPN